MSKEQIKDEETLDPEELEDLTREFEQDDLPNPDVRARIELSE